MGAFQFWGELAWKILTPSVPLSKKRKERFLEREMPFFASSDPLQVSKSPFSKIWLCKFWRRAGDEDLPQN
jgi:hypothetical protein